MKIEVVKAESDLGVSVYGTRLGPTYISDYLNNNKHISRIYRVSSPSIKKSNSKSDLAKNFNELNIYNERLYLDILKIKNDNKFPLVIGGDHSIAIASALASIKKEENLGIIWIDSHADFNNFESTLTGNIHGMPFSTITGNNGSKLSYYHDGNYYNTKNAVAIGTRDYYPIVEEELIRNSGITIYDTKELISGNVSNIIKEAFAIATKNTNGVHISFDIDIMDYSSAPGVSVPAVNGIDDKLAYSILEEILKYKDSIKSFDLVEYNPINDKDDVTKNIVIKFIDKVIKELSD